MKYALHYNKASKRTTLVEATAKEVAADPALSPLSAPEAHRWVKDGCFHETGLWVDDLGRVRYAKATAY